MISDRKLANAVGGKTARACDSCIRNRARWYCAPDDAFLCQACDASVHSANPLARMHKRARLKIASFRSEMEATVEKFEPSWYHGFTRKARTPRHGKHHKPKSVEPTGNPTHLVPEMGNEENFHEDNEQQLLYSVPLCDDQHVVADMYASIDLNEFGTRVVSESVVNDCGGQDMNILHGFLASEMDLEEFAAPVEIFLGKGLDEQPSFVMEGLGLLDNKEKNSGEDSLGSTERVKVGEEVAAAMNDTSCKESFELNLNYELFPHRTGDEQLRMKNSDEYCPVGDVMKKKISLSLDYEGVIAAWADVRSPWTTGERPELDPNNCLPDCKIGGNCGSFDHLYRGVGRQTLMVDSGREAKVSRYREKRRTRFFSKKIRYEVRKLNAEKRPRIKGRFVKRTNNLATATAFRLLHNNRQPLQTSHVH